MNVADRSGLTAAEFRKDPFADFAFSLRLYSLVIDRNRNITTWNFQGLLLARAFFELVAIIILTLFTSNPFHLIPPN